jgi:hypothetical protein
MDNFIIQLLTLLGIIACSLAAGWFFGNNAGFKRAERYFRNKDEKG